MTNGLSNDYQIFYISKSDKDVDVPVSNQIMNKQLFRFYVKQ